jgi:hypothetical protein
MSYERANELQDQANAAEVSGDYKKALELQTELAPILATLIENGEPRSEQDRRDKMRQKATKERLEVLSNFVQKGKGPAPKPLPSKATVAKEMNEPTPGTILLSKVSSSMSALFYLKRSLRWRRIVLLLSLLVEVCQINQIPE